MSSDKYGLIKEFIQDDGGLHSYENFYVCWDKEDHESVLLDGSFEPDVLRQIADYIDEHGKEQ